MTLSRHYTNIMLSPVMYDYYRCMHTYVRTCLHTYIPTYTYIPIYVHNIFILGADDMGISGDLLPRTLSRWHEHGFVPKHVQADDLRVVDNPIIFFFCAPPFLGFDSRLHERDYVTCLVAYDQVMCSCTTAAQGRKNTAAYVTKAHEMSSQLWLRECSWWNDSEPLAESLHLLLHAWRPCHHV